MSSSSSPDKPTTATAAPSNKKKNNNTITIPSFHYGSAEGGSEAAAAAQATDFANYFCSYAQLYHQKQMLADHNRMAAYHAAIMGNSHLFENKVVMDVGTGSGILAVWAAQAGAKRVYAVEYTDMAKHAKRVMQANGVDHIVTVIQGAVEDVVLPDEGFPVEEATTTTTDNVSEYFLDDFMGNNEEEGEEDNMDETATTTTKKKKKKKQLVVDIMISEWMGYFLLRESMLDSLIYARELFLKPTSGIMLPSHATMYLGLVEDEEERLQQKSEYHMAMQDWLEFAETTSTTYGVNMSCLHEQFEREQREYYLWSSRWVDLSPAAVLGKPCEIKSFDLMTCTLEEARGITLSSTTSTTTTSTTIEEQQQQDGDISSDSKKAPSSTSSPSSSSNSDGTFSFHLYGPTPGAVGGAVGGAGGAGMDDSNVAASTNTNTPVISGFAGWFTADFKTRTDANVVPGKTPILTNPTLLSTGPEGGHTHWGQQVFYLLSAIPLIGGETTVVEGSLEMSRGSQESARLYNCRIRYSTTRRKTKEGTLLMKGGVVEHVYQIP